MSIHNIGFHKDWTKIIFQLSSNTHLISSSGKNLNCLTALIAKMSYQAENTQNKFGNKKL